MVSGGWKSIWTPPEQAVGLFDTFLKNGYTVIAVRHGSSPRYVIPEIAVDVRLALKYIYEHADQWKIDRDRLGVFGFSAGGHLSLLLGTRPVADKANGEQKSGPHVALSPPYSHRRTWLPTSIQVIRCASSFLRSSSILPRRKTFHR